MARIFRDRGFRSFDTDEIVHTLLAEDQSTIEEVALLFGPGVLAPDGGVIRSVVGERAFAAPDLLAKLEAILHPRVRERWREAVSSGGDWVVEIPLLFEKNLQNNVDLTVCVSCHPEKQVERLEIRGMKRSQALARMNRQMPLPKKMELADYVLLNDGSLEFLEAQVARLILQIETH